jgi:hypothetical protein
MVPARNGSESTLGPHNEWYEGNKSAGLMAQENAHDEFEE